MSERHRFSFSICGAGRGEVIMDGRPIEVMAFEVHVRVNEPTRVVLTFEGVDVDTDVEAELMKHHEASEAEDVA